MWLLDSVIIISMNIEWLRSFRLDEYAIFDITVSFLGMLVLSPLLSYLFKKIKINIPKKNWLYLTLPIGILVHILVGQNTKMVVNFLDPNSHYVLKGLLLILFYLGIKDIKHNSKNKKSDS